MKAYRTLAERGETATADRLQLWEREHSKHRDVHIGELAALQTAANIAIATRDAKVLEKMASEAEMNKKKEQFEQAAAKKWQSYKSKMQNRKYRDKNVTGFKERNEARKLVYSARVSAGQVESKKRHAVQQKRL